MTSPRKVLHVLNSASGGAALSTLGLISSLREKGIESGAVCHNAGLPGDFDALREATRGNLFVTPLYWWNRKIRSKTWKRPLLELLQLIQTGCVRKSTGQVIDFARAQQPDLIHSNTILTLEGGYAARQMGLPHVWHLRELVGAGQPFRFYREGAAFGRFVGKYADRLVANSHATASLVRDWLPPGLLEVVPNGIDIERFTPTDHTHTHGPLIVGMVANLSSQWKRHDRVIEIAARVNPSLPIEWRFYGLDPSQGGQVRGNAYLDGLHNRIEAVGLRDRFRFRGHIADPMQIMSEIDILIHTAEHESFGRVIVEAMAAGLPVVGVAGGGLSEIVVHQQTGYLYPTEDFDSLARAIERLAKQPDLRNQMGQAGRERAVNTFSLAACADRMANIYSQLVSGKAPVPASRAVLA